VGLERPTIDWSIPSTIVLKSLPGGYVYFNAFAAFVTDIRFDFHNVTRHNTCITYDRRYMIYLSDQPSADFNATTTPVTSTISQRFGVRRAVNVRIN